MMLRVLVAVALCVQALPLRPCPGATAQCPTSGAVKRSHCQRQCPKAARKRCARLAQQIPTTGCLFCKKAPKQPVAPPAPAPKPTGDDRAAAAVRTAQESPETHNVSTFPWPEIVDVKCRPGCGLSRQAVLCIWLN